MSGFTSDWLDLREGADRRARDATLLDGAIDWLREDRSAAGASVVVDLGAGTGSTLRALEDRVTMPLTWRLVDHDPALLAEARRRHGGERRMEAVVADLSRVSLLPLRGARLITASALFDLVSAEFVDALAQKLKSQCRLGPVALYCALNYDGTTDWAPAHPLDDTVLQRFNGDQRRDKGFGPALGPDAGDVLRRVFTRAGFEVRCAASPWVLDGADKQLVASLITGIADAVSGSPGLDASALSDWVRFRQAQVPSGTCTVGHTDLLALPGI